MVACRSAVKRPNSIVPAWTFTVIVPASCVAVVLGTIDVNASGFADDVSTTDRFASVAFPVPECCTTSWPLVTDTAPISTFPIPV